MLVGSGSWLDELTWAEMRIRNAEEELNRVVASLPKLKTEAVEELRHP